MAYLAGLGVCLINVVSIPIFMVLLIIFVSLDFVIKTITCLIPCKFMNKLVHVWNQMIYQILLSITCLANACYDVKSNDEENED